MINEWEEFCAYTGTVSYTASKKAINTIAALMGIPVVIFVVVRNRNIF